MTLAVMAIFGATLTLPGIAGVILTIGMGVDSNVLIFERIREELRGGKAPASAVDVVMMVLEQLGLLHHHRVETPVSRPLGWHVVHTTAVLRDVRKQEDWSIDTWTRNNGELPEVMTLAKWLEG